MSGHTPGPWEALVDDQEDCAVFTANERFVANIGGDRIACISPKDGKHVVAFDMTVADAKLIAAAPDLLAAAKAMIGPVNLVGAVDALDMLKAAVEKAENG